MEEKYAAELVVVGVHSAKFNAEKATDNVRRAIMRYEIEHPVINDADFIVWGQYAARAWPTLMFIGPDGKVVGKHEGEFPIETLDNVLGNMIAEYDSQGLLDRRPLDVKLERDKARERPLSFPGKVLATSHGLFIADSNHNRILWTDLLGSVTAVIGSGERGLKDGPPRARLPSTTRRVSTSTGPLCTSRTPRTTRSGRSISNLWKSPPSRAPANRPRESIEAATDGSLLSSHPGTSTSPAMRSTSRWQDSTRSGSWTSTAAP